jgi:hypothetical protein
MKDKIIFGIFAVGMLMGVVPIFFIMSTVVCDVYYRTFPPIPKFHYGQVIYIKNGFYQGLHAEVVSQDTGFMSNRIRYQAKLDNNKIETINESDMVAE